MNNEFGGFNHEVFGTNGWPKFGTPMAAGKRTTEVGTFNAKLDETIAIVKGNASAANAGYLAAFTALSVQLQAIGALIIDGKPTV